jgi:hypothetical protein
MKLFLRALAKEQAQSGAPNSQQHTESEMPKHQLATFATDARIRTIGIVGETAETTKYFTGFDLVGFVMKPRYSSAGADGKFAKAYLFFNRTDAEQSMDDLISWYDSEGVRHGHKLPDGLAIILLNP